MSVVISCKQRAHTIITKFVQGQSLNDLPASKQFEDVLDLLFDPAETPAFARRERAESLAVDTSVLE
jgi:hypothetical protein